MKKSLFAVLSILFVGQLASAASHDARLQFAEVPTGRVSQMDLTHVTVYADGVVEKSVCKGTLEIPCATKEIKRLSADEMDTIESLIADARDGKQVRIPNRALCFVAPFKTERYTADNGKVFLKSGHLCNGWLVNDSEAAGELVGILAKLRMEAKN